MTILTPLGTLSTSLVLASKEEYDATRRTLTKASARYYRDGSSPLDDATYDALAQRLSVTEALHPEWVEGDAFSTQVGAGAVEAGDVKHSAAMLSLDNVFSLLGLEAFMDRVERLLGHAVTAWRVEPKFDGMALAARYESGTLVGVATRGDGTAGEDVSDRVGAVAGLPAELAEPVSVEIRGECVMSDDDFRRANEIRIARGESVLKNPRNAVAGALRTKEKAGTLPLSFFAYTLLEDGREVRDQGAAMAYVASLGVAVSTDAVTVATRDEVANIVEGYLARRATLGVPIDGAVIKVDVLREREAVGSSSRSPRWATAYKYPADARTTDLLDIVVDVGRTGNLSFTAVLEPVDVGGVTVSSASVHNPSVIATRGLRLADVASATPRHQRVWVRRAGDVIPEVTGPVDDDTEGTVAFAAPTACPRCHGPLDTTGLVWRCSRGRACAREEVLLYAVSRDCLDIEGMGPQIVASLVASGHLEKVTDLFSVTREDLLSVERLGEKNADKILAQIDAARLLPLSRVFCALGITLTGRRMSRRLAQHFGSLERLRAATPEDLEHVEGVGDARARSVRAEMDLLADELDYLLAHGIGLVETTEKASAGGPLAGETWVVTGTMTGALAGKTRADVTALLESLGARVASSVTTSTTVLLVGEKAGSKKAAAEKLGVRVVSEATFAATWLGDTEG